MASQPRVAVCKKQLYLDLRLLNKVQPMLPEIAQLIFEKNGLQKPTQNLINHICYYLLSLIDPLFHSTLQWPLYDRDAERAFRNQLSAFITDYAAKGRLTDVKASFLVHPTSYKVTVLMEELSELAVKQMIIQRIKGTEKQKLYDEVTKKYIRSVTDKRKKSDGGSFDEYVKGLNYESTILDKISIFSEKKQTNERIAQMLRTKITQSEEKLSALNAQRYIDSLVDGFVEKYELDESLKSEILKIKNINEPAPIFDVWLEELDRELDRMEETWDAKVSPLLEKSRQMQVMSEELVNRELGLVERSSYTLVYDPQKDFICTEELQSQVNSTQKYILENMQKNGRLDFPKLIQAYVISMGYILKGHNSLGDGIHEFNERLSAYQKRYSELKSGFIALLENVDKAEKKLEMRSKKISPIPLPTVDDTWFHVLNPPKISGLKMCQNQDNISSDSFTPLRLPRHKFNLHRREEVSARPPPKSILTHAPKDDFLKTLHSHQTSSYDRGNMSVTSDIKATETKAGCSSSFTREQIVRMLSTNKKTSLRKHTKEQQVHDDVKIKKCGLSTVLNPVTAKDLPSIIITPAINQKAHLSKMVERESELQGHSSKMITVRDLQEAHSSKMITARDLQEAHSSKMITARDLQEAHSSKMITAGDLQEAHSSKMITARDLQEAHSSKMITARDLQEAHSSKMIREEVSARPPPKSILTHAPKDDFLKTLHSRQTSSYDRGNMSVTSDIKATETKAGCSSSFTREQIVRMLSTNKKTSLRKHTKEQQVHDDVKIKKCGLSTVLNPVTAKDLPSIIITPAINQKAHLSKMVERESELQGHSSKMITARDLQEAHSSKMITARDLQEVHSSKMLTAGDLQEAHSSKMITARDLQEAHSSKMITARDLQEAHSSKMITARDLQEAHSSKMIREEVSARPPPKSILTHAPKDDFLKTLHSRQTSSYDRGNMSVTSDIKATETKAGCSSSFTREQIVRMLSTNKKTSLRKHTKEQQVHDDVKIKKCGLSTVLNPVTAKDLPSIIITPAINQKAHLSKMVERESELQGHSSKMITARDLQEAHSSKMITARDLQEAHSSKMITARDLQEAHSSKMITARDLQEAHSSKMITARDLQEAHSSKMITTGELQEGHSSKMITATPSKTVTPRMSLSSINMEESHSESTPKSNIAHIKKTSSLENIINRFKQVRANARDLQEAHSSKMITARDLQEAHSSKMITARDLQEAHSSKMITARDLQEAHSSKMITTGELQEGHSSKMITATPSKTVTPRMSLSSINMEESHSESTPKSNIAHIKKTSSLENIINRFKQVRANVPLQPVREENENLNINDGLVNRNLLPDLLSPNLCNTDEDSSADETVRRGPRVSLGTMLGVDDAFLDQFDLID